MKKLCLSIISLLTIVILAGNVYSQGSGVAGEPLDFENEDSKEPTSNAETSTPTQTVDTTASDVSKKYEVVIGVGYVIHTFSKSDKFREGNDFYGGADEIKSVAGMEAFGEYFFSKELSAGFRYQSMEGGVDYISSFGTFKRRVQIVNNIVYGAFSTPLGKDGYWRFGGNGGLGSSTYTYKVEWDGPDSYSEEKSASGTVLSVGLFFDWGKDAFGGRLGMNSTSTSYGEIYGEKPDGSGSQLYIDVRYAF